MISYQTECGSRLPCGLCLITNQACPFFTQTFEPSCTVLNGNEITTSAVGSDSTCRTTERQKV